MESLFIQFLYYKKLTLMTCFVVHDGHIYYSSYNMKRKDNDSLKQNNIQE